METDIDDDLSEADFRLLTETVHRHCGISLNESKRELVRARIAKQVRSGGFPSAGAYLHSVLRDPSSKAFTLLIDALSTNLTSFFREHDHFSYLTNHFLPSLIERKRKAGQHRIRAWSAACSTGEEPYSLAMTLLDFFDRQKLSGWDIKLLATDIATKVLRQAECAVYDRAKVTAVPQELQNKYLAAQRIDGKTVYAISPVAREIIRFRHLNLMDRWPFSGPFDFIFCRNVMIYFDKPTQQKLVNRFFDVLEPRGLLFTGHSESLTGITHTFDYVQPTIYGKR